ncbi:MAG: YciI family protein [Alphaproteobacteria bacterium]|nr:YciI family protein [Alphaproteobacteria bacterium]
MLYAIIATDKPGSESLRQSIRPAHLEYLLATPGRLKFAGPFLSEDGATPTGSLMVIEAATLREAKAWLADEPFAKAGLFAACEVKPWRWTLGAPS